jgi:hypothetical protein
METAHATKVEGATPESGAPITAGERQVGTMGSAARGRRIALLDRVAEAEPASLTARRCSAERLAKP